MQAEYLVAVEEFCTSHNVEESFIKSLQQSGLIEITTIKNASFIDAEQLQQLERFVCFYYELDINFEGIETIVHMLQQIKSLQEDNTNLRNRLRRFE